MHPHFFLSLMLGGVLCLCNAQAQQPDSGMDQILHPKSQSFDLMQAKRVGLKSYDGKIDKIIDTRSASAPQKFDAKGYLTGKFTPPGNSSFWLGDFKYSVKEANTNQRFLFLQPGKWFGVKSVPAKTAESANKKFVSTTIPTRDFRGKERDKFNTPLTPEQATDNSYTGPLTELKSIDDVRALLNKNK